MAADPREQLGTGAPRSELSDDRWRDDGMEEDERSDAQGGMDEGGPGVPESGRTDPSSEPGAVPAPTRGSHPAFADEVRPNRSGSGGSGGAATDDEPQESEGSGTESMQDLLAGGEVDEP